MTLPYEKTGGPAFPTGERLDRNGDIEQYMVEGMTLRDYFIVHLNDENEQSDYSSSIKEALVGRPCPSFKENPLGVLEFEAEFRAKWRAMRADAMLEASKS